MQGALIANLSGKKFTLLMSLSIIAQIICFLIGGFVTEKPIMKQNILAIACEDDNVKGSPLDEPKKWYYTKKKGNCEVVDMFIYDNETQDKVHQVVYTLQFSLMKNININDYSRWQQNVIGILHIDIKYHNHIKIESKSPIVLDMRLAYRDIGDPDNAWKLYEESKFKTILECSTCNETKYSNCECMPISLFKLDSYHHDYYLLNIRFPLVNSENNINQVLYSMSDLWLTVINQDGNFMKLLISLKIIFFPIVISFLTWYWRRVRKLIRSPTLLQYMILILASALSFLNMPLKYLILYWEIPLVPFLTDLGLGLFYMTLFSFLLIFIGEHSTSADCNQRNNLKYYWRHLSGVVIGTFFLFISNVLAAIFAGLYLIFLIHMVWKISRKVSNQKVVLPGISLMGRLHHNAVINRFKFLMVTTVLCASLTIIEFLYGRTLRSQWAWDEDYGFETISTFFISIYGMWNIYIIALLCLYAPSRKIMIS